MAHHEVLGIVLAAFQLCTLGRGTDDGYVLSALISLEAVGDTAHERVLRSDDEHVNVFVDTELLDTFEVVDTQGDVLATVGCSGVARSDIEFLALLALCNLPCQGVLAAATA